MRVLPFAFAIAFGGFGWWVFEPARPAPEQGGSSFGGSVPVSVAASGRAQQ